MQLKFLGAAGCVTGSKYLLTINNNKYLVDCGLFQGPKKFTERNWAKPDFEASEIKAIVVTHAHIDHTGYIPRLINLGFNGPIYCSSGTYELSKILLPDSGHLQEEEAFYANKKGYSSHKPALPLYTREDAENALSFFNPIEFHKNVAIDDDVTIRLTRAGHILGASCVHLEAQNRRLAFSGDVGRFNDLIMKAPEPLPDADYLILESTYGDREHENEDVFERLAEIINSTVKRHGTVVIPAFAVGRSQNILYVIQQLKKSRRIPDLKTYLDSPMAINATDLYCQFIGEHKLKASLCADSFADAIFTRTPEESKKINENEEPKIVISASGMVSGGRILHHLAHYISDKRNSVILVGYQAEGTHGRALLEGADQIKLFGEYYKIRAHIENVPGLSAHADRNELVQWLKNSPIKNPRVFLIHGEPSSAASFREFLSKSLNWQVEVAQDGEEVKM